MLKYLIVILSVFAAACAQMLLKQGARQHYTSFVRQYLNAWVIGGYGIMFLSLALNIYAMSQGVQVKEVSIIESLSYLFVPCLAFVLFGEKITLRQCLAVAVIIVGIIVFFM